MNDIEFLADLWCNGTREDRASMSYVPLTFTEEQRAEFDSILKSNNKSWFIHYFENGFE